jgi:hypothetical protein
MGAIPYGRVKPASASQKTVNGVTTNYVYDAFGHIAF